MPYDTIGSIWMPNSKTPSPLWYTISGSNETTDIVCTFTVKPGDCWDTIGNFRSPTIFPSGLADIRKWTDSRKADFPGYWFHNARSIQCGGSNF
jgi:hypothetical protein